MESLYIYYGIPAREEVIREQQGLVHITAGIVPHVKDQVLHPLFLQLDGSFVALLEGSAGELAQAQVADAVGQHERGVHAVHRNLAARNLKGNGFLLTLDGYGDLGPGRALEAPHHTVLRELHAGNHRLVHLQQAVSGHETHLFGRTAGDDLQHDGRVVGDVELDADTVKIAGKLFLRGLQFLRRQVYRVRVQLGKGGRNGGVRHALAVEGVHVILFHHIQYQVQLAPVCVPGIQQMLRFPEANHR